MGINYKLLIHKYNCRQAKGFLKTQFSHEGGHTRTEGLVLTCFSRASRCCCHLGVSGPVPQSSFQAGLVHLSHPVVNLAECTIILSTILCHGLKDLMGNLDRCSTEINIPYIYISLCHQSGNLMNKVYNKLLFKK